MNIHSFQHVTTIPAPNHLTPPSHSHHTLHTHYTHTPHTSHYTLTLHTHTTHTTLTLHTHYTLTKHTTLTLHTHYTLTKHTTHSHYTLTLHTHTTHTPHSHYTLTRGFPDTVSVLRVEQLPPLLCLSTHWSRQVSKGLRVSHVQGLRWTTYHSMV